jgi:hypothetical protein
MDEESAIRAIDSPWLPPKEASKYCGISESLFNQIRKKVPIKTGGTKRRPRFHIKELDYWMERCFEPEENPQAEKNIPSKHNNKPKKGQGSAPLLE